ncbi:MAG TPA: transcription-repair coupling factor [Verrucomicrobia bacterium]|nr:MAG: transcription-repair coupling factor [Lentisphaerae bacterium GWF2_57_35]HBA83625.1 transcription-repair coupling factor [Verrucomicrobiota bacterium]
MNGPLGTASVRKKELDYLAEKFREGRLCYVQSLPESAQAFLAWNLWRHFNRPILWLVDSPKTLDLFYRDLGALAGDAAERMAFFPARESLPGRGSAPHADLVGDRLKTLQDCLRPSGPTVLATCIQAIFQPVPTPAALDRHGETLKLSQEVDLEAWVEHLAKAGYKFEPEVLQKGQASKRGGVVDIWPPTEDWPVRLEFFGPTLDSIRTFDPTGQRSLARLESITLSPADEADLLGEQAERDSLLSYLPADLLWVWAEPESIYHHAEMYRHLIPEDQPAHEAARYDRLRLEVGRRFKSGQLFLGLDSQQAAPAYELDLKPCESLPNIGGKNLHPDRLDEARRQFVKELAQQSGKGRKVHFFFNTEGSRDRFLEQYREAIELIGNPNIHLHPLSEGFECAGARLTVVAESDLYGFRKRLPGRYELHGKKAGPERVAGARIAEWTDIQPGELVVHMDHGIGKYLGLYEIEFDGRKQEVLAIEYAEKARLYVPVSQTHLLSRYVGVGRHRPELHALGGKRWIKEKIAAEKAVRDLASALIDTQAHRDALDGHAFAADSAWQHEFEASFPYQETEDQRRAIQDTKTDMESKRPMDRLICGDVGYGKTEVAMRAAFKAVMDGKQVAVLVPTTILAQQHYDTFAERMAAYPVAIEVLSRFRTRTQQAETVRRLREGSADIVIGTHRLLQADVKFDDLGLVIIDEEQRFGVAHKEHLKELRQLVDVLTLTATPIPRTLYMSLTGAKDMSTIQTPPQERLPVETIVTQNTDEIVREATLRELNRGGQVFYLHNRVMSIYAVQERLKKIVPEARVEVGHGQMHENDLAEVMHRFVRGEFDILLCTTIIESGVDIPNVNTILIDRADRFGMADLYQLRGRVGRYKHQAYAYLLLPRHGHLFDNARKRIGAIKRYSSLGAGFKLALRDLEIRGAGNMLGAQQSGHIAAIGFDLYCQLLRRTVAVLKGEQPPPIVEVEVRLDFLELSPGPDLEDRAGIIPADYIEDENLRVGFYRKIASCGTEQDVEALYEEARDRFGPIPAALDRLLKAARLRIVAAQKGLQSIEVKEDKVMMMRQGDYVTKDGKFPRLKASEATKRMNELLTIVRAL